jgi:hypothetical protein
MINNILESMFDDFIKDNMIGLSDSATKELLTDVQFFYKYCHYPWKKIIVERW